MITRDITSPGQTPVHRFGGAETPAISPSILQSPELSFTPDMLSFGPDTPSRRMLQRRQRTSDVSMLSIDMSSRCVVTFSYVPNLRADCEPRLDGSMSRDSRSGDEDDMASTMQNSMWSGKTAPCSMTPSIKLTHMQT